MVSDTWYDEVQDKIFTCLEHDLMVVYPDLFCTTDNQNDMPSHFPTLYLHQLASPEIGQDLEGKTINAMLCTMEIQVCADTGEADCRSIMNRAVMLMKSFGFVSTALPIYTGNKNLYIGISRFRRTIGGGDSDIINQ